MTTIHTNRESGFTLLELLLVIGVAALLLIGGIATYRLVSEGNKATEAIRQVLTIKQEASVVAQNSDNGYADVNLQLLVDLGVLRSTAQLNPFNGTYAVGPSGVNFSVALDNITSGACIKMAMAINNPNEVVSINGTAPPITIAQAQGFCGGAANTLTWIFP